MCWGIPLLYCTLSLPTEKYTNSEEGEASYCSLDSISTSPSWTLTFWNYIYFSIVWFSIIGDIAALLYIYKQTKYAHEILALYMRN
jgi:hypothetical protein